jgi:hypothetical protein
MATQAKLTSGTNAEWAIPAGLVEGTKLKLLQVGGGGGGGAGTGGGGGAGGLVYTAEYALTAAQIAAGHVHYTIGAGGAGATPNTNPGTSGGDTIWDVGGTPVTSKGGGGGGSEGQASPRHGLSATDNDSVGSGGGGAGGVAANGGYATNAQGNDGGAGSTSADHYGGGGGGGAGAVGGAGSGTAGGGGGIGIDAIATYGFVAGFGDASYDGWVGGGGGAGTYLVGHLGNHGAMGKGNKGLSTTAGDSGGANTGGGGNGNNTTTAPGGAGGTGVIVILYTIPPAALTLTTDVPITIRNTRARLGGTITHDGYDTVDYYGFVYDTATHGDPGNSDPDAGAGDYPNGWKSSSGNYGETSQGHEITSLAGVQTYYFRAAAHNSVGWVYGSELSFTTEHPVKLIWDTDEGGDPDCAADISMALHLADLGECEIIAYTSYHDLTACGQCIEAALATHGRYFVPVGINKSATDNTWVYNLGGDHLGEYFANLCRMTTPYPDATTVMRAALAAQPDHSVTYILGGPLMNLRNLYDSADDYDSDGIMFTGAELIEAKVREIVLFGGDYPTYHGATDYNMQWDAPASQVMNDIATNCPTVRVVWEGISLGDDVEYDCTAAADYSYVKTAHRIPGAFGGHAIYCNYAWEAAAVLYAIRGRSFGDTVYIATMSPEGKNVVAADGHTDWSAGDYNQWYLLTLGVTNSAFKTIIEDLMCAVPTVPVQRQVAASDDDLSVSKNSGTWTARSLSESNGYLGDGTFFNLTVMGIGSRFLNLTVPHGAKIVAARLLFKAKENQTGTTCYALIVGCLQPNTVDFADAGQVNGATPLASYQARRGTDAGGGDDTKRTVAEVSWTVGAWAAAIWYYSPDLSPVLQEIIDQSTYASGNAVALFVDDHEGRSSANAVRTMYAYDQAGNISGAILQVVYQMGNVVYMMNVSC